MQNKRLLFILLLGLTYFVIGCANDAQSCGNKVLTLWPSNNGFYSLSPMTLLTLSNPYDLNGPAAKIYFESRLSDGGYEGPTARPRLTQSDDTCVPLDTDSSMAISAYLQMERLMAFDKSLGVFGMLPWPRRVGVEIHLRTSAGGTHNNAHYDPSNDVIAILPYSLSGVPSSMNLGILAHEHFHAHFQRQVLGPINFALTAPRVPQPGLGPADDLEKADLNTAMGLNAFVLRAWNEGLADVYAGIYTGDPHFLGQSLPALGEVRALTAELKPLWSGADLRAAAENIRRPGDLAGVSYGQGAVLARMIYQLAFTQPETPQQVLAGMLRRLQNIPPAILPVYSDRVLEFDAIVPILVGDLEINIQACEILRVAVSKNTLNGSFAQCAGL